MTSRALYSRLAEYYDDIYWWKDYGQEVSFIERLFEKNRLRVSRILEVACGTGNHTRLLASKGYQVTGVDISEDVLRVARRKVSSGARFLAGDMRDLDAVIDDEYDAVLCLFSAISYNLTATDLKKTLQGFYRHLKGPGIVVFDTHFTKRGFVDGHRSEDIFDDGRVFGARLGLSRREGETAELRFSYLIKDGRKVILLRDDVHRLRLYDSKDFLRIMGEVGLRGNKVYTDWSLERRRGTLFADSTYAGLKQALP